MTDSIGDVLGARDYSKPSEIDYIKSFVRRKFDEEARVRITPQAIIITVDNASLATMLRMHLHEIKADLNLKKHLRITIG